MDSTLRLINHGHNVGFKNDEIFKIQCKYNNKVCKCKSEYWQTPLDMSRMREGGRT